MDRNWLYELLDKLKSVWKKFSDIRYCWVSNFDPELWWIYGKPSYFIMYENNKENISKLKKWLKNYDYDSWYGWQELFWEIVFNDDSWFERREYDGAEWWEYKKTPDKIDFELFREAEKERKKKEF